MSFCLNVDISYPAYPLSSCIFYSAGIAICHVMSSAILNDVPQMWLWTPNNQRNCTENIGNLVLRSVTTDVSSGRVSAGMASDKFEARKYTKPALDWLTHYELVTPYGGINLVNIGPDNRLVSGGIKPLPEPMLNSHQLSTVAITWDNSW